MPRKRPQQKNTTRTLDDYAAAIQKDYADLAAKTEVGFKSIRGDMAAGFREVREDIKNLNDIIVSKADLAEVIRRELDASPFTKERELKELGNRLEVVERKLGIDPSQHGATA